MKLKSKWWKDAEYILHKNILGTIRSIKALNFGYHNCMLCQTDPGIFKFISLNNGNRIVDNMDEIHSAKRVKINSLKV